MVGTVTNIAELGLIILLYTLDAMSLARALTVIVCTDSAVAVITVLCVAKSRIAVLHPRAVVRDFKRNWRLGKWNLGSTVTSNITGYLYPIALAAFIAPAETAIFGVCSSVAGLSNPVIMGLGTFLGPHMAERAKPHRRNSFVSHTKIVLLLAGVFFLVYLLIIGLWGESILVLLYGNKYGGNYTILVLVAVAAVIEGISCPAVAAINALERPQVLFASRLAAAVFALTAGVVSLWFWGVTGAAISSLMGAAIATVPRFLWLYVQSKSLGGDNRPTETGDQSQRPATNAGLPGARPARH